MQLQKLQLKLKELCGSGSTLLWLEGSQYIQALSAQLRVGNRLVLRLANDTTRVMTFDRFAITKVGLQFWSLGKPGVLYRWEQVPAKTIDQNMENPPPLGSDDDFEPPPGMAA